MWKQARGGCSSPELTQSVCRLLLLLSILVVTLVKSMDAQESPGCELEFAGKSRVHPKNRLLNEGAEYAVHGDAEPLVLSEWFELTCDLEKDLPKKVGSLPEVIEGAETVRVTVRAHLMAVKLSPDDNDFHVQIGPTTKWTGGQVVVEIPPGQAFCDARTTVFEIAQADREEFGGNSIKKGRILRRRPLVDVTGFIFFDGHHGSPKNGCKKPHASGIRGPKRKTSPVKGLFEIHPVTSLTIVEQ